MIQVIHSQLKKLLKDAGVTSDISFSTPPNRDMGDLAFACFPLAKEWGKAPNVIAEEIADKIEAGGVIAEVKAFGPYVNFFLDKNEVARLVLEGITSDYGKLDVGTGKKTMVEYACPNPMKAFHLGHLKNLITGESVARLMDNAGYSVIRANYQGDVGMHIAKTMWGLLQLEEDFLAVHGKPLHQRIEFLGKAYAYGATEFEASEKVNLEIKEINAKVYTEWSKEEEKRDKKFFGMYWLARSWSLEYFAEIYERLNTSFLPEELYFESQTYKQAIKIVKEELAKGIFFESEGAILFPGEKYGLHDRVYINSEGYPTYDAKELALSKMRFEKHPDLDEIIHVVGKEQTEYFKVVFAAYEAIGMKGAGKESHIPGGFLQLKGEQKMSSRKGNVITGDQLLDQVRSKIVEIMIDEKSSGKDRKVDDGVLKKVTAAALKYAMLKADITKDVAFDLEESISTSGNSGPYLLYIVARIKSILKNDSLGVVMDNPNWSELAVLPEEHALVMQLAEYPAVTREATEKRDTSVIAKYLFDLAQAFNSFYAVASVVDSEGDTQAFRVQLITHVRDVMTSGLEILGIETVDEM